MFFSLFVLSHRIKKKKPLRVQSHILHRIWKRASLSASEEGSVTKGDFVTEDGSVTVEAAIVVPILLCAFMAIMLWGKVFLLQQEIETALLETAKQIARQEHILKKQDKEGLGTLSAAVIFLLHREQGDEIQGIEISFVSLAQSEYREETKEVYLNARYQIKIPMFLFGTWNLPLQTSVVQKAWNGYVPDAGSSGEKENYVYVTEHGEAYHTDSQCYHLHVTIRETTNTDEFYSGTTGYRPCEYCILGRNDSEILYITDEGECYHEDLACSGLTRTVKYVKIADVGERRLCADCGGEE